MTLSEVIKLEAAIKVYPAVHGFSRTPCQRAFGPTNVTFHRNETVALVGRSGAGKSSLGRCLAGLEPLSEGRRILGASVPATAIQMVFQDSPTAMNPRWTVDRLLREPLRLSGEDTSCVHLTNLLQRVGLGNELLPRRPHQLSGGQRRRLLIARALAMPALQLLVLDEPLAGLDPAGAEGIVSLLRGLQNRAQFGMLLITHDLEGVPAIADRVLVMENGHIVEQQTSRMFLQAAKHPESRALIRALLPEL